MERKKDSRPGFARISEIKPKAIKVSQTELIRTEFLEQGQTWPLIVRPNAPDINLIEWIKSNTQFIESRLLQQGAILFRDFDIRDETMFDQFARSFSLPLMDYLDQHTPRTRVFGMIYTSTEYPADHTVPFHSENSKNHIWPLKIWFFCLEPAQQGGETPLADNRKVAQLIPPAIKERFVEKRVMYVRNFGEGVGLPWQRVFQTSDKSEVENYFKKAKVEFEWRDGDRLRTRHVCQAVARHAETGEVVWFNQAHLFHISSLDPSARESLLSLFKEEDLPSNAYYGDGTPIETSALDEIRECYKQAAVSFGWQKRDLLMLDNMAIAHGRNPFSGNRRVLVAMAEPFSAEGYH